MQTDKREGDREANSTEASSRESNSCWQLLSATKTQEREQQSRMKGEQQLLLADKTQERGTA